MEPNTHLPVELLRDLRVGQGVSGSDDAAGELVEDDGLGGDGGALLLAVVLVVHPDADDLVGSAYGSEEDDLGARDAEPLRLDCPEEAVVYRYLPFCSRSQNSYSYWSRFI